MEDRMLKEEGTGTFFSPSQSHGKKAWQSPSLTEVDYRETRAGGSFIEMDGGGYS